jgi:hypothetical protein
MIGLVIRLDLSALLIGAACSEQFPGLELRRLPDRADRGRRGRLPAGAGSYREGPALRGGQFSCPARSAQSGRGETCGMAGFRFGIAHRGASIRIPGRPQGTWLSRRAPPRAPTPTPTGWPLAWSRRFVWPKQTSPGCRRPPSRLTDGACRRKMPDAIAPDAGPSFVMGLSIYFKSSAAAAERQGDDGSRLTGTCRSAQR